MSFCIPDCWAALASEYPELTIGRITLQERGIYRIRTAAGRQNALVSGRFQFDARSASDYPAVGDYVMADCAASATAPTRANRAAPSAPPCSAASWTKAAGSHIRS